MGRDSKCAIAPFLFFCVLFSSINTVFGNDFEVPLDVVLKPFVTYKI